MRVIVSQTLQDTYQEFVVVDNFRKIRELKGVDVLIIHTFAEEEFEVGVFINEFYRNGVKKFVYINKNPLEGVKAPLVGVNGHVIEDEFFLEDEEELIALLDELDEGDSENTSLAVASMDIIGDFIKRFEENDESIKAPLYLEQVKDALNELSTQNEKQHLQLMSMGSTALETFEKASTIISNISKQRKVIEDKLNDLATKQQNQPSRSFGGGILFYPTYKYMGVPKLLFIREYSHCRYLTSFILAYEHYLHYNKNKRVKLIFVHQKGQGVAKKYTDFTSITQESMYLDSLYDSEIIATNNPKSEVLKKIFSKPNDIFIVVDRLYGQQDIVSGRVSKLSAVSGKSDLKRFNIDVKNCIFPVVLNENAFINLPTIRKYPDGTDMRRAAYMQLMKKEFEKIDNFLQLPTDGK